MRRLTQALGLSVSRMQGFLCAHRDLFPVQTQQQQHQRALEQVRLVYAQLVARGERVSSCKTLAKAAHVRVDTALEFLRAERSKQHATS